MAPAAQLQERPTDRPPAWELRQTRSEVRAEKIYLNEIAARLNAHRRRSSSGSHGEALCRLALLEDLNWKSQAKFK
jgi:hypothetical protein